MTETTTTAPAVPGAPGLFQRLVGTVFSPRATYTAVAARPRWLGALAVSAALVMATQYAFLSSEVGRQLALDQQVSAMEGFGVTVTDEMYDQMAQGIERQGYIGLVFTLIFIPIVTAVISGIFMMVFTMLLGGAGTFRQVFAVVSHAGFITAVAALLITPLSIATGRTIATDLGLFVPMLEETSFVTVFLGAINLLYVWWFINLAIGLGVLYRRRTGPIATTLLSLYAVGALAWAAFRSGS